MCCIAVHITARVSPQWCNGAVLFIYHDKENPWGTIFKPPNQNILLIVGTQNFSYILVINCHQMNPSQLASI